MKKLLLPALLLLSAAPALATEVITVSRLEVGKLNWPLTREEIMLTCDADGALFAINDSTLMQYPLNDKAQKRVELKMSQGQPISLIQAEDKQHPGQKMDLQPLVDRAQQLCR